MRDCIVSMSMAPVVIFAASWKKASLSTDKSGVWGFHGGTIRLVGSCSCGRDSLQLFRSSAGPSQFLRISAVFKKAVYVSSFFGYLLLNFC